MRPALLVLALSLPAVPGAAAPLSQAPADALFASLRRSLLAAAAELDGFDENKAWLAKLPMRMRPLSASMLAYYDPPSKDEALGAVIVDENTVRLALKSLEAAGFEPARALPAVVWLLLPTVIHETQHAIQIDELTRRGGVVAHFVEMEVDGKAAGVVAYLQVVEKHPEAARLFMHGKSYGNDELAVWRAGAGPFRAETLELYRAKDPLIPSLRDGEGYFKRAAADLAASIAEIDADLTQTTDPEDLAALARMRSAYADQLAVYGDPKVIAATLGYFSERDANVDELWARWAAGDPKSRLAAEPGLPAKERAELHLRVARQLAVLSPTLHADDIEDSLSRARAAAVEARAGGLALRASKAQVALQGQRLDYAIDIVRGRAAVTSDPDFLAKVLAKQDEHLRSRLFPQYYRVFKDEILAARAGR